jgi:hypothetical protein
MEYDGLFMDVRYFLSSSGSEVFYLPFFTDSISTIFKEFMIIDFKNFILAMMFGYHKKIHNANRSICGRFVFLIKKIHISNLNFDLHISLYE